MRDQMDDLQKLMVMKSHFRRLLLGLIVCVLLSGCATTSEEFFDDLRVGGSSDIGSERDRPWQYSGNQFEFEGW